MSSTRLILPVLAVAALAGAGAWLALGDGGGSSAPRPAGYGAAATDESSERPDDTAPGETLDWNGADLADPARRTAAPAASTAEDGTENGDAPENEFVVVGRVVDETGRPVAAADVEVRVRRDMRVLMRRGGFDRGRFNEQSFRRLLRTRRAGEVVTTDGNGEFRIRGNAFPETHVEVRVSHSSYAPAATTREWNADEDETEVRLDDIELEAGVTVVGRVVDPAGVGFAGAAVSIERSGGRRGRGGWGRGGSSMLAEALESKVTNGLGEFRFEHVPTSLDTITVAADAERHLPARSSRVNLETEDDRPRADVDVGQITIRAGVPLTGLVLDPAGSPIVDAEVTAERLALEDSNRADGRGGRRDGGDRRGRGGFGRGGGTRLTARSDDEGRFTFEALWPEGVQLEIEHPDFLDAERELQPTTGVGEVEIIMQPTLRVTGVVVDARTGQPIESYGIRARRAPRDWSGRGGRGGPFGGGRDDNRGRRGGNDGAAAAERTLSPEEQARRAEREAERQQRDAERTAQRAALEAFRRERLGPSGIAPRDTPEPTRHESGRFDIGGLEEGRWVFDIDAPGYVKTAAGVVELDRSTSVGELTFRLDVGTAVEGIVRNRHSGDPVARAEVELVLANPTDANPFGVDNSLMRDLAGAFGRGRGGRGGFGGFGETRLARTRTDRAGRFRIPDQRPGEFVLRVEARDHVPLEDPTFVIPALAAGAAHEVEIQLAKGTRVFGQVVGLEADAQARIVFVHAEDGDRETTRVRDGSYDIEGLKPGGWFVNVEVSGDGGSGWRQRVGEAIARRTGTPDLMLADGAELEFSVRADDSDLGRVEGRVDVNNAPAVGYEVRLQPLDDVLGSSASGGSQGNGRGGRNAGRIGDRLARLFSSRVDADGNYAVDAVPPGRYALTIRGSGGRGGGRGGRGRGGDAFNSGALHHEEIYVAAGSPVVRHVSARTGSLALELTAAGDGALPNRVSGFLVLAEEAAGQPESAWSSLPSYRRIAARGGNATVTDLPAGIYSFQLRARGFTDLTGSVTVLGGASEAEPWRAQLTPAEAAGAANGK